MKFIETRNWAEFRISALQIANVLESYTTYLHNKNVKVQRIHTTPQSNFEKKDECDCSTTKYG